MKSYKLHLEAENRLSEIWEFTFKHWGYEQADRYTLEIEEQIKQLCDDKIQGKIYTPLKRCNVKYARYQKHYIFYLEDEKYIFILTILHGAMDMPEHIISILEQ